MSSIVKSGLKFSAHSISPQFLLSLITNCLIILKLLTKQDLNQFFQTHYDTAVQRAVRIVGDIAQAEDIAQECMVKLWNHKDKLGDGSVRGYFFTMIRNKSIDHLRKVKPQTVDLDSQQIAERNIDVLEFEELKDKVHYLIDGLPDRCRQVFVLSRFEEMSYQEIADQLNISKKTVENQISKALNVLRKGLLIGILGVPFSIFNG